MEGTPSSSISLYIFEQFLDFCFITVVSSTALKQDLASKKLSGSIFVHSKVCGITKKQNEKKSRLVAFMLVEQVMDFRQKIHTSKPTAPTRSAALQLLNGTDESFPILTKTKSDKGGFGKIK